MKPLKKCKVLVTPTSYASQDPGLKVDLEDKVAAVEYNTTGRPFSSEQLQAMLPGVDGMIAGLDEIDDGALAAASELRVIARYGVGISNVDLEAAERRGILVTNTPGANSTSVAELTVALMLNLLRPVTEANRLTKEGQWPRLKGKSLEGKIVGLYGLGAIGREVARRLAGFNCALLAHDLVEDDELSARYEFSYVSRGELLRRSDLLSLHLPATPETRGMVNDDFIDQMKDGAWLVNTARGELIDEEALSRALKSGKLLGAALDVFQEEPPAHDNPLLAFDNVIATPHMGAHTDSATNNMGRMALEDCLRVLSGQEPKYRVV